ncbi:MAG TPA: helix-turn-helix transcriptional regulator [Candidatus Udaeobacter sp.]|nr:helix-turn-helix transcriptional regulator [Candidatus Udaeobacter sp.]
MRASLPHLAEDHPRGHYIPPHTHRRGQLVFARSGVMQVETAAGLWIVPPQRAVWVPPRVRHAISCGSAVSLRTLYVSPAERRALPKGCAVLAVSPLLRELIIELCEGNPAPPRQRALSELVLSDLLELPAIPIHLPEPKEARLRRVTDALKRQPADERGLSAWASMAGASPRTLTRLFIAETGMTFRQWRRQLRFISAIERLAQHEPVTAVALDLGYSSVSAFIESFRKTFGVTPYRYFRNDGQASVAFRPRRSPNKGSYYAE